MNSLTEDLLGKFSLGRTLNGQFHKIEIIGEHSIPDCWTN